MAPVRAPIPLSQSFMSEVKDYEREIGIVFKVQLFRSFELIRQDYILLQHRTISGFENRTHFSLLDGWVA